MGRNHKAATADALLIKSGRHYGTKFASKMGFASVLEMAIVFYRSQGASSRNIVALLANDGVEYSHNSVCRVLREYEARTKEASSVSA